MKQEEVNISIPLKDLWDLTGEWIKRGGDTINPTFLVCAEELKALLKKRVEGYLPEEVK